MQQTNKPAARLPRKNTSVWVREDLWRKFKVRALQLGLQVSEATEQAIEKWLKAA